MWVRVPPDASPKRARKGDNVEEFKEVPLDEVFMDEDFNSRGHVTPASVYDLSLDIEKNGLFQPIVIQPHLDAKRPSIKWKIVMGHRRYLATRAICSRNSAHPAVIMAKVSEKLEETKALVMNLLENMEREPLNILQEARALERFVKIGHDSKKIAELLGQPKKWVEVRLALLSLPEPIQKRAEAGWLTQYNIEELAEIDSDDERFARVRQIVDHEMRGKKMPKPKYSQKALAKRIGAAVFADGEPRSSKDMFKMQEHVQDQFGDNAHPAATAIAWAAGILSDEDFFKHCIEWAAQKNIGFERPAA